MKHLDRPRLMSEQEKLFIQKLENVSLQDIHFGDPTLPETNPYFVKAYELARKTLDDFDCNVWYKGDPVERLKENEKEIDVNWLTSLEERIKIAICKMLEHDPKAEVKLIAHSNLRESFGEREEIASVKLEYSRICESDTIYLYNGKYSIVPTEPLPKIEYEITNKMVDWIIQGETCARKTIVGMFPELKSESFKAKGE